MFCQGLYEGDCLKSVGLFPYRILSDFRGDFET